MLKELIENIGYSNILDYLENNFNLGDCVCIRLEKNANKIKKANILVLDKKQKEELPKEKIVLMKWFQERAFYSTYLNSNKAIVCKGNSAKLVVSCVKDNITFNYSTFLAKAKKIIGSDNECALIDMFNITINEYFNNLTNIDSDVNIDEYRKLFEGYSNAILDTLKGIEGIENKKVRLFIDEDLEIYRQDNISYLNKKIFDNETEKKINNTLVGRYGGFLTLNPNKPLLKLHGLDEINLCTKEEAIEYRNLLLYLGNNREKINGLYGGEIKVNFNPKEQQIENFDIIPYEANREKENLIQYKNILHLKNFIEGEINIANKINYLLDGYLFKQGFNKYDTFYFLYKDAIEEFVYENNTKKLINNAKKIMNQLIDINIHSDSPYRIPEVVNFNLNLLDSILGEKNKELMEHMYEKIFEKIKNYKKEFIIENDEEFIFLAGQMAYFLVSKSKAQVLTNKLLTKYIKVKKLSRIKEMLAIDFNTYSYDESLFSRINKIFADLMNYDIKSDVISEKEKNIFLGALFGENLLYKSTKNEEEKIDEEEK